jgi:putative heme transporter
VADEQQDPPRPRHRRGDRRIAVPPTLDWVSGIAWRLLVVAAALVVLGMVVARLRLVVIPLLVALVLSTFLVPPGMWLKNRGVRPALAAFLVLAISIGVFAAILGVIVPQLIDEFSDLGEQVSEGLEQVEDWLRDGPAELSEDEVDNLLASALDQFRARSGDLATGLISGAVLAIEIVAGIILTLVIAFFFVKDGDRITDWFLTFIGEERHEDAKAIADRSWNALAGFLRGSAIDGVIEAVMVAVALWLLGIPLIFPLAFITFFAGFFPVVGAILAGVVASLVALVSGGVGDAITVAILFTVIQQVQNNLLEPFILARAVKLHPLAILVTITTGAILGGIPGAFFAVPLLAASTAAVDEMRSRQIVTNAFERNGGSAI